MTRFRLAPLALALALLAPLAARAQAPAFPTIAVPEPLRGVWFAGGCTAPAALLALSARGAARLPADGAGRLLRFTATRAQSGWTVATARGAEAPRLMLRAAGDALETAEPANKTRDDRLPGDVPLTRWQRCPSTPLSFAAQGEGIAFLGAIEVIEAGCGPASGNVPECAAAIIRAGDVSGDNLLGTAELARLFRGATWLVSLQAEVAPELSGLTNSAGAVSGVVAARLAMESLDYDGDGRLSARELAQDRATLATGGDPRGRPLALERLSEGAALMRGVIEGLLGSE
jgi:YD repeat-containing protein